MADRAPSRKNSPARAAKAAPAARPRRSDRATPDADAAARDFAIEAARLLKDDKCEDVVLLDVREQSQVTDFIVIGSGTSERQMRSVLGHAEELGAARGFTSFRTSKDEKAAWLLADFVHVVVHLFEPNTRAHYDLEMLWGDAPRLAWERPDQRRLDRAGIARA